MNITAAGFVQTRSARIAAAAVAIQFVFAPTLAQAAPAWGELPATIQFHIVAALAALCAGLGVLAMRRGTPAHRALGRIYLLAMLCVAIGSFWIRTSGTLSWIHALSAVTIVSLAIAWFTIRSRPREGRIPTHAGFMTGTFTGLVIAGAFTLLPNRIMGQWLLATLGAS